MRKTLLAATLALVAVAFAAPATADASGGWYWSPERAAHALEIYEDDTATGGDGAFCSGTGDSIRGRYSRRLYRKFNCDLYAPGDEYLGSGTIKITGESLRRYRWLRWDSA